ncbi:MAG: glycoside hydrolase family 15 protein, partial [Gammaproteobacteria bacterium]|nr:glycoside hydrolase family 15 protein [Gammaproteobacteria bacterium]
MNRNLDLGVIGNCVISALIDRTGSIVWSCLPRLDGDPVFHALVNGNGGPEAAGHWTIELDGMERCEQEYQGN